jgi:hypothetical protein
MALSSIEQLKHMRDSESDARTDVAAFLLKRSK